MYSRQCSDRCGNSASTGGVAAWMSQSTIIGPLLYTARCAQQRLLHQQFVLSRAIWRAAIAQDANVSGQLALVHHLPRHATWPGIEGLHDARAARAEHLEA